jgi:positive regulator of sigma E activity
MIETRVRVLAVNDGIGRVEATEGGSCAACSSRSACAVSGIGRFFDARRKPIELACGSARPGDEIRVRIDESDLLRSALWAYILPILLGLAGALALSGQGDPAAAMGLVLGLAAGLWLARRLARPPTISITSGEAP